MGSKKPDGVKVEVSVTTDFGTFSHKTLKGALALAAAAEKKHHEERERTAREIEWAYDKARSNAFRMMRMKAIEPDRTKRPWDFVPLKADGTCSSLGRYDAAARVVTVGFDTGEVKIHTSGWGDVTGFVMSGNGYPAGIGLKNYVNGTEYVMALGKCGDHVGNESVPGVTREDFNEYSF